MSAQLMQDGFAPLSYYGKCDECSWTGINRRKSTIALEEIEAHNQMVHTVFQPAILTTTDYNGHTPHMVTGQDFTESPKEEGENHALKILTDALRVKNMRIKQLENEALERETLNTEMRQTIQELLETPDPMPLCKNLVNHNYVPLDTMFVFCTHCGHSIHYKTK